MTRHYAGAGALMTNGQVSPKLITATRHTGRGFKYHSSDRQDLFFGKSYFSDSVTTLALNVNTSLHDFQKTKRMLLHITKVICVLICSVWGS